MPSQYVDIIGPGALGLHLALALPDDVTVRLRHPNFASGSATLTYADASSTRRIETLALDDPSPIQSAIFTTKAFHVMTALRAVLPALNPAADVVLLHNGLGPQDNACALFPGNVWVGTTTEGALRTGPWEVRHTGLGTTLLGPWRNTPNTLSPDAIPAFAQLLLRSRWNTQWVPTSQVMQQHLWRKVIINCAINPLTALHNLRNGDLLAAEWRAQWHGAVNEAVTVANTLDLAFDVDTMMADVQHVMQATAQNYSSMHQDWQHGRPTEADFILGAVIRQGAIANVPTVRLSALYQALASTSETLR